MTNASEAPPLACREIADAVIALRERGLRLSTARRLVLEALFAADGPVSAEHIMHRLSLDLTSVYRNLETLERHGLVSHVHLGHGPGLYALRGRGEREYLYCERCSAVRAVRPEDLDPVRALARARLAQPASCVIRAQDPGPEEIERWTSDTSTTTKRAFTVMSTCTATVQRTSTPTRRASTSMTSTSTSTATATTSTPTHTPTSTA